MDRWWLEAFDDLSTCRANGWSLGEIPWTAAMDYADRNGIYGRQARYLWKMVHRLDGRFLAWLEEKKSTDKHSAEA